jgi:hypothetical protein
MGNGLCSAPTVLYSGIVECFAVNQIHLQIICRGYVWIRFSCVRVFYLDA